jgi:acyl dehydratase
MTRTAAASQMRTELDRLEYSRRDMLTVTTIEELRGLAGQELGVSEFHELTQDRVDEFAEITGDRQ